MRDNVMSGHDGVTGLINTDLSHDVLGNFSAIFTARIMLGQGQWDRT